MASEQYGFRWRADDGSEAAATWLAAQDVDVTRDKETPTRLRVGVDHNDNPAAQSAKLQFKRSDEAAAEWRDVRESQFDFDQFPGKWAWLWSGEHSKNLRIAHKDSSGHRAIVKAVNLATPGTNDFTNTSGSNEPGYEPQRTPGTYTSPFAPIAIEAWEDGTQHFGQGMTQAGQLGAAGEFYLATAFLNARTTGDRFLLGQSADGHYTRIDQLDNLVTIALGGAEIDLTAIGSLNTAGNGENIVEIWRDASNNLHCWINGADATTGTPSSTATFNVRGFGGGTSGASSDWDDDLLEIFMASSSGSAFDRLRARHRLNTRWNLGVL